MAFTHIRGAAANGGGGIMSFTLILPANPTQGNLVCVTAMFSAAAITGTVTVKDSNNNIYTATPNSPSTFVTGAGQTWLFYLLSAPSNATATLTISWTTFTNTGVAWGDEFSYSGTCFFDKDEAAFSSTNHTTINTPSITPTNAGSLLYAGASAGGTITHPVAGATLGSWTGAAGAITTGDMAEYDLSASSATPVDFTQTSGTWSAMSMAFYTSSIVIRELSLLGCGT